MSGSGLSRSVLCCRKVIRQRIKEVRWIIPRDPFVICMSSWRSHGIQSLLQKCRYEPDLDIQVNILLQINRNLPSALKLKLPSLFTDDYIRTALDSIEEKLLVH